MSNRFSIQPPSPSNVFQGKLLVATPQLDSTGFERSVILLMQHDDRGTFGVAINKPATDNVKSAWQHLTGATPAEDQLIVAGGPLQGPVIALHQVPDLCDVAMPGGIFVAAQVEKLNQLAQYEDPYRIVVGLAGWKDGQLKSELESGYWYLMQSDADTVFENPDWMWECCIDECGRQQIAELMGYYGFPDDPSLN